MRIAYINPYQGREVLDRRPILKNLGLAANVKMELISELLTSKGHDVEIFSQGEVVELAAKFYPGFKESKPFHKGVPVTYASAIPIRFVNGFWSNMQTVKLFKRRHREAPFDAAIIYNLKGPQVACAHCARETFGIPTIVEYEDDAFVDVLGRDEGGVINRWRLDKAQAVLDKAAGCIGVSPHLLSRFNKDIPRMLLRGVVDKDVLRAGTVPDGSRANRVVFSGTHYRSKGLEPLIAAWKTIDLPGWELHIAGRGELTTKLEQMADGRPDIVFHGLLGRKDNAELLGTAKIGINPHELSSTPGNVFAFKIIEYLAAGLHVITTPMGELESELEQGVTYMEDNQPAIIARTLRRVIAERSFELTATRAAHETYGPEAVARALDELVRRVGVQSTAA